MNRQMQRAILCGAGLLLAATAWTQEPTTQPAATQPADRAPLTATVLEVQGDAQHAPLGSDEWQPCAVGDTYPEQTVIRTGIRSSVKLQIGEDDTYTAVVVDSATKTVLSELFTTPESKRVRIGVGYGRIRAGVVEGGLKSDFTVDSPVATLSKRGTWNFGLFYERGTDRFEIFLLDQGLVEAFDRITRERRTVLPREQVTQAMRRWMDEVQLLRNVPIPDILGQGDIEVAFNQLRQGGLRVLDPEGGVEVLIDLRHAAALDYFERLARLRVGTVTPPTVAAGVHPEGYFGTGRGDELIPIIIQTNSPLVQQGLARPGTYQFRRSTLEGWLAGRK